MAVVERDVVLVGKDEHGNQTTDYPVTRLGNVQDGAEIKDTPGEADYIPILDGGRMKKTPAVALGGKVRCVTVKLPAAGWTGSGPYTIDAAVNGVLADAAKQMITPAPAPTSWAAAGAAGVYCSGQAENSLTFTAGSKPKSDLIYYVALQEAEQILVPPGNVTGISAEGSGNGKLTVKWTDPAAEIVVDGNTVSTWAGTKVVYREDRYPRNPEDGTLAVDSTTRNAYAVEGFQITGLVNGKEYYIAFFPVSTDGAVNTNAENRIIGVPNRMVIDTVPAQKNVLEYNGNKQTPEWDNYDPAKMTLGGTTEGINTGTYNATFTPTDDYCWADGSTTAKTVVWEIRVGFGEVEVI